MLERPSRSLRIALLVVLVVCSGFALAQQPTQVWNLWGCYSQDMGSVVHMPGWDRWLLFYGAVTDRSSQYACVRNDRCSNETPGYSEDLWVTWSDDTPGVNGKGVVFGQPMGGATPPWLLLTSNDFRTWHQQNECPGTFCATGPQQVYNGLPVTNWLIGDPAVTVSKTGHWFMFFDAQYKQCEGACGTTGPVFGIYLASASSWAGPWPITRKVTLPGSGTLAWPSVFKDPHQSDTIILYYNDASLAIRAAIVDDNTGTASPVNGGAPVILAGKADRLTVFWNPQAAAYYALADNFGSGQPSDLNSIWLLGPSQTPYSFDWESRLQVSGLGPAGSFYSYNLWAPSAVGPDQTGDGTARAYVWPSAPGDCPAPNVVTAGVLVDYPPVPSLQITHPDGYAYKSQTVTLSAASSTHTSPISRYTFTFGDGASVTQASPYAFHKYATPGSYGASVEITDAWGLVRSAGSNLSVVAPQYGASFNSQSVPSSMVAGSTANVSITMSNTGGMTWTGLDSYKLGFVGTGSWGATRAPLAANEQVSPGGTNKTFAFTVTAPSSPGTYTFQWQMLQEGVAWFGPATPAVTVTVVPAGPTNVSVTPSSGGGSSQIFRATIRDAAGAADVQAVGFLFQSSINGANAVYLWYGVAANQLYLANDAGNAFSSGVPLGATGILSNSQAMVDVSGATVMKNGTDLTLSVPVAFKYPFNGPRNLYLYSVDNANRTRGWEQLGTFAASALMDPAPTVLSVSPATGTNASQLFHVRLYHPSGAQNINQMMLMFQTNRSGVASTIYVQPQPAFNNVFVSNDQGGWNGPQTIGSGGVLENGESYVDATGVGVVQNGTFLDVYIPVAFKAGFNGARSAYVWATDVTSLQTPWIPEMASFTVNASDVNAPMALYARPIEGGGTTARFNFKYRELTGAFDGGQWYFLINDSPTGAHGVYLKYADGSISLRNDDDSAWSGGYVQSNSQATVRTFNLSVSYTDVDRTVSIPVTFSSSFVGKKKLYMWGVDRTGAKTPGWQEMGSFSVTSQ